jgi:hypothetical protein
MDATLTIAELREFASFTPAEQRYIERALDIGLGRAAGRRRRLAQPYPRL